MSVESKVKDICEKEFADMSYVFDDWYSADRAIEKVELPAILNILPVDGRFSFRNGRVKDAPNMLIAFLDEVKMDANGEDNEKVYSSMKERAVKFIDKLNESGYFEKIDGDVPYQVVCERLSCVVSGIVLSLTLKEVKGVCA